MKLVIAGGTGQVGAIVARACLARGDDVVVLSRGGVSGARVVAWDGRSLGAWREEIDGCDVVLNLAGRSVNCRYTPTNLAAMMSSRVESTRAVGQAIAAAARPPRLWLQMSTATIYAHRFDAANDEATGRLGGDEPDAPGYWRRSVEIAQAWERALQEAPTPRTRKIALRTAMVMSPDRGGIFDVLLGLVRRGLGGAVGGGRQFVSWIHDRDFVRALDSQEPPRRAGAAARCRLPLRAPRLAGGVPRSRRPLARRRVRRAGGSRRGFGHIASRGRPSRSHRRRTTEREAIHGAGCDWPIGDG
jgi:uncharacterized protein (TIGR01777 family)